MELEVSIDRLTIVAYDSGSFSTLLENSLYIKGKGFSSNYGFRHAYSGLNGEHIEVGDKGKVRVDFNPNKADMEQIGLIMGKLKYPHLTRMDIAVDYFGKDLSHIEWTSRGKRKRNMWVDQKGVLETLYIGAPSSDKRFRIYNKRLERLEAGEEADPRGKEGHWRIEVQKRYKERDNILDPIEYLLPDLFDITPTTDRIDLSHIEKVTDRVMITGLLADPSLLNELSKNSKTKYLGMIKEAEARKTVALAITPQQAYEKEKSRLATELIDLFAKSDRTLQDI